MKNQIAFRYTKSVVMEVCPKSNPSNENISIIATVAAEMFQLGYVMSVDLLNSLKSQTPASIQLLFSELIPVLKKSKGADVKYIPFYPNFPQQVMGASDAELFVNAILHYWTYGSWCPEYVNLPREFAYEEISFKEIGTITEAEFRKIFTRLLSSNDSISEADKKTVDWFIRTYKDNELQYPDEIPFKENLCYVAGILFNDGRDISKMIKTATDVLRVFTYLSDGDISLAENTRYVSLPRSQRKKLISILEKVATEEDINRHRGKWVKAFHSLHVGDYSSRLFALAKKIRNNEKIQTFNGKVQAAIEGRKLTAAIDLLKTRPSEFARRVDHLIRSFSKKNYVIDNFLSVVDQVPTRILLQLLGNTQTRTKDSDKKIIFPKGNAQRAVVVRTDTPRLSMQIVNKLKAGIKSSLFKRFQQMDSLGNVWIDPDLIDCPVPSQQRSASEGLFQVARGTALPVGDKNTLRFFIYWVGRDIDLSATLHDESFKTIGQVSYTNLRSSKYQACHSGDITYAPRGASEFIDITMNEAVQSGARYVAMNVYVYSGPTFKEHEKCYAGWMTRSHPNNNEIFDPKTVQQKIDVTSETKNCIPVVFDMLNKKAIWVDLTNKSNTYWGGNNVHSNRASIEETIEAIVSMDNKVSLYELFLLHAQARGKIVEDKEDADVVFSMYEGITPYNIDIINSDYLA